RAKEALWTVERSRIDPSTQCTTRRRYMQVKCTCKPCNAVEEDDNILLMLDKTKSTLKHKLSNLDMIFWKFIEGRSYNFTFNRTLHIRYFFWSLINEQYEQLDIRMVCRNAVGNFF